MFKRVTREKNRLRFALDGPSGSGKTYTAFRFAFGIKKREGGRVAVIDSEHNAASLYAGESPDGIVWDWEGVNLQHFAPSTYRQAIEESARRGFEILVIDSLSHAWVGTGGALDQVDRSSAPGGKFGAWRDVTPQHNGMIDTILRYPGHVIVTLRSKMEYILEENERGKKSVTKVGLKPIQREGTEYEFTIVGDLDLDHRLTISKTRCPLIDGKIVHKPDAEFLSPVLEWLYLGEDPKPELANEEQVKGIKAAALKSGTSGDQLRAVLKNLGADSLSELGPIRADELLARLEGKANVGTAQESSADAASVHLSTKGARASELSVSRAKELWRSLGRPAEGLNVFLRRKGVARLMELEQATVDELIRRLETVALELEAKETF